MGKNELIAVFTILIVVSANLVAFLLVRYKRESVEVDRGSRERIIQSIRTHLSSLVENGPSLQSSMLQAVLNTGILDGLCNDWCSTDEFNDLLFDAVDTYGMNLDLPDDVCGSIGEDYDRLRKSRDEVLFDSESDAVFRKHLSDELLKVYWAGYLLGLFHLRFYVEHGKAKGDLSYALWGARPSVFVKDEMPDQVFRRGWSDGFNARLMI